jgi:hypothetical protein
MTLSDAFDIAHVFIPFHLDRMHFLALTHTLWLPRVKCGRGYGFDPVLLFPQHDVSSSSSSFFPTWAHAHVAVPDLHHR